jgi:DNA-directed RNA polymerase specialized sigma24 family protein
MIVTLYYADDLTVGQIAQLLDTSRGAIKAALFKARRTLRRRLDEENRDG